MKLFSIRTVVGDGRSSIKTARDSSRGPTTFPVATASVHTTAADLLVTFNGARFDVPFLEQSFDLSLEYPHLDLLYPCRQIGLDGGLKAIERTIGLERDRPDVSGEDAVRLWREYERGDEGALETLVSYNREDAVNLRTLADTVTERLHADVFEPALDP